MLSADVPRERSLCACLVMREDGRPSAILLVAPGTSGTTVVSSETEFLLIKKFARRTETLLTRPSSFERAIGEEREGELKLSSRWRAAVFLVGTVLLAGGAKRSLRRLARENRRPAATGASPLGLLDASVSAPFPVGRLPDREPVRDAGKVV